MSVVNDQETMVAAVPRISRLSRSDVSVSSVAIYDRTLRDRGNVPNMFRTMAHRPEIFETIIAHMDAVLNTGTLSKALKELVIVRTSQLNRTPIAWRRIRQSVAD
jgi:alkylhydroperoxidase family enzyme